MRKLFAILESACCVATPSSVFRKRKAALFGSGGHSSTTSRPVIMSLHDYLQQLPEVLALLNVMNNALCILAVEKKPTSHLVLPILSCLKELLEDSKMGVVYRVLKLILESFLFELNDGCLRISEGMKPYFMRASACYPSLRFIDESLAKDCMTVGEAFYQEILARFSAEEREGFCGNAQSLERYIDSVQGFIPVAEKVDKNALKRMLKYREGGKNSMLIRGTMGQEMTSIVQLLIYMEEEDVDKQLKCLEKSYRGGRG